jgi:hypothetical protein
MGDEITGKARGGKARAEKLTPDERKEIAQKAASARWSNVDRENLPRATHRGELNIDGTFIPCAVLENGKRVLSELGITMALLGSRSGASKRLKKAHEEAGAPLPLFLAPNVLKPFINEELLGGPLAKITYIEGRRVVSGFDANLLPLVCDIWLRAREAGVLQKQQLAKAQKAEILTRSLAKVAIVALVDEATGYQAERSRDALQELLALYLTEEKLKWAKTFPDEFYKQLFRLKGWAYNPFDQRKPKVVGKLTNQIVYQKLPPGVLGRLRELNPVKNKTTWRRGAAFFQFLSEDIGQKDLRDHFLQILPLMRASKNWNSFIKLLDRAIPDPIQRIEGIQEDFDFGDDD